MGEGKGEFQTTHWSEIQNADTRDETHRRIVIDSLMRRYWKPVYCYLRRKGYANEPAKDLTQGFFHEIVLGHELIQQADQAKGRFRTFLLTAIDRYASSVYRRDTAKKRMPTGIMVQLEDIKPPGLPSAESEAVPEEVFNYAWAAALLDEVLAKVRDEYCGTGKATHWEVFRAKVLAPIMNNTEAPSLAEICTRYGIGSEAKASNMIVTVKRRFRTVLTRSLRQYVQSGSEVEDELNALFGIVAVWRAG